jgi:hypothetical protein
MASQTSQASQALPPAPTPEASRLAVARSGVSEPLLRVAERELKAALIAQNRPIVGMYAQQSEAGDAAIDHAVHAVCREAHTQNVRAEELLIALKQAWSMLATTRVHHLGERDADVLRDFITATIEVFFEPSDARSDSP